MERMRSSEYFIWLQKEADRQAKRDRLLDAVLDTVEKRKVSREFKERALRAIRPTFRY